MCGIAGFIDRRRDCEAILGRMTQALIHRGPDDFGSWTDGDEGVYLGFRRLSILDLTEAGHQPMVSHSGRLVGICNGEVYNFEALRQRLAGVPLRGHSDAEVLVEHVERYGLQETLKLAAGMYAVAIWDRQERTLSLARDRIGEKPLYYGWQRDAFLFGSELKALRQHPAFRPDIDRNVLAMYLQTAYVPSPWSIYQGVYKLPPGTFLTLSAGGKPERFSPFPNREAVSPTTYWDFGAVALGPKVPISDADAIESLDQTLRRVIESEMVSDVPLGGFLSGGIDSSTIVAVMQAVSPRPVRTFTVGFHEAAFNEAEHAQAIARHLGTEHTEQYVTSQDTLDVLPLVPSLYDEPFADPSEIPTYLVSRMARQHVTVCLSGDGGDELFGGYNRYFLAENLWRKARRMPRGVRVTGAKTLRAMPPAFYDAVGKIMGGRVRLVGDKAHKLADILSARTDDDMYVHLLSQWHDSISLVKGASSEETTLCLALHRFASLGLTERMMATEVLTYLPDDIMVKVDRAAMGVSLESRAPFLHHDVVELAWSLPLDVKVRDGRGKWLLRQVLDRYVPRELIERPKMGFAVPIDSWLRGPLRDWAEPLLDAKRLETEGFLEPEPIRRRWQEHLSGRRNWQYQLWSVLMFQAWLAENRS